MKSTAFFFGCLMPALAAAQAPAIEHNPVSINAHSAAYADRRDVTVPPSAAQYILKAHQKNLAQQRTWQRLMYMDAKGRSEVKFKGYFFAADGDKNAASELDANISALFQPEADNQSIRCRFPARSEWIMRELDIALSQLPAVSCPELDEWYGKIKPYTATLIYATDFMGNPSSMFGHTLLRIDPENQKQLNLVSYAVNYAATVQNAESWSYAWKGLTGQYPGEYSLMPYYRKVKEYGDFESRDLWEYELNLNPQETQFLVKHIWEMQQVSFPYYFASDNCAYRLLGLFDLARPELNLAQQFKTAVIPVETIKSVQQQGLIADTVYRPALETQLLHQAKQHGHPLARMAHHTAWQDPDKMDAVLSDYGQQDQARILEMAYDDLYLALNSNKVQADFAQPRLRQLLKLRSKIDLEKQRQTAERPAFDPSQGHHARNIRIQGGESQNKNDIELGLRQAYHDLIDPQQGYRLGTQLIFLDGAMQYRDDQLKLEHLSLLSVNSYNPVTPFKQPLSWGFDLGWQQEALNEQGKFSSDEQHGLANLNLQAGYSWADSDRKHLCYGQLQAHVQGGQALDQGWRAGIGPTAGCQNIWTDRISSVIQLELPYWADSNQWNLRLDTHMQYLIQPQHALRLGYHYEQQAHQDWSKWNMGYVFYY